MKPGNFGIEDSRLAFVRAQAEECESSSVREGIPSLQPHGAAADAETSAEPLPGNADCQSSSAIVSLSRFLLQLHKCHGDKYGNEGKIACTRYILGITQQIYHHVRSAHLGSPSWLVCNSRLRREPCSKINFRERFFASIHLDDIPPAQNVVGPLCYDWRRRLITLKRFIVPQMCECLPCIGQHLTVVRSEWRANLLFKASKNTEQHAAFRLRLEAFAVRTVLLRFCPSRKQLEQDQCFVRSKVNYGVLFCIRTFRFHDWRMAKCTNARNGSQTYLPPAQRAEAERKTHPQTKSNLSSP